MKTLSWKALGLSALLLCALTGVSRAGTIIEMESTVPGQKAEPAVKTQILIDGQKVLMEAGEDGVTVFDAAKQEALIIHHPEQQYIRLNKKSLQQISAQVKAARAQMDQMLAQLPPEQRKMMEARMSEMGMSPTAAKVEPLVVKKLAETKTIDGRACNRYEIHQGKALVGRGWVAEYGATKVLGEQAQAMRAMSKFFQEVNAAMGDATGPGNNAAAEWMKVDGLPMDWETLQEGKVVHQMRVTKIQAGKIDPKKFAIPKGYSEQKLDQAPGSK